VTFLQNLRPVRDWNDFWFRPHSLTALGLFRILLGFVCLMKLFLLIPFWEDFFSERGMLTLQDSQYLYSNPRICVFDFLPLDCAPYVLWTLVGFAILYIYGCFTRISAIALVIGMLSLDNRNPIDTSGGDRLLSLFIFFSIFAPTGGALSLERLWALFQGKVKAFNPIGPYWAVRMMQVQMCLLYFWSAYIKIRGQSWIGGEALYWTSRNIERARWPMPFITDNIIGINFLTGFTLLAEGLFPFLVWSRRTRWYGITLLVLLHLGIEWSMTIQTFSFVVFCGLFLYYEGEEIVAAWERIRARFFKAKPLPVFYDGDCGFCTRSVEVTQAMDVFHRLNFMNFRDPQVQRANSDLDLARCENELLLKDRRGRWYGGFSAFRRMFWLLPATWLLAPFCYLPGAPQLGRKGYQWIAGHRFLFPVGGASSCALPSAAPQTSAEETESKL
jgi:predicted DCC family thiol-disulfide oxidoreductase YuxK